MVPVCRIVVLPSFQLRVCGKKIVNVIPLVGERCLTSNAEQSIGLAIKAPIFSADCILGSLDHSHEFPEGQRRIWITNHYNWSHEAISPHLRIGLRFVEGGPSRMPKILHRRQSSGGTVACSLMRMQSRVLHVA